MSAELVAERIIPAVEVPTHWYNLAAELPTPPPPHLHPGTREPVQPSDLAALFPAALIAQEASSEVYLEIPEAVREIYRTWRPSPLIRAARFERALNTRARIYVKYEGVSPVGSHKANSAVAQAYFNSLDGVAKLTTETGAGQWGSALAFACAMFDIELEVWQVRASYGSKPYRRHLMNTYGATVHASPSELTDSGRAMLAADPETTGSLGMAVSEAVEMAAKDPQARYALAACSTMWSCIRASSDRRRSSSSGWPGRSRLTSSLAAPAVVRTWPDCRFPSSVRSCMAGLTQQWSPPSRPPAPRSPKANTATTTATRPG